MGLQYKVHTHISCPKTTLSNSRQLKFPNPQEDVIEHTFYYVPIYDCKYNHSTLLLVPQFMFWLVAHPVEPADMRKWEAFSFSIY